MKLTHYEQSDIALSTWLVYLDQYQTSIYVILETINDSKRNDYFLSAGMFLPLTFLIFHYLELWIKVIRIDCVMNPDNSVVDKTHKTIKTICEDFENGKWRELGVCDEKILSLIKILEYFDSFCCGEIDMEMAMRYPIDLQQKPSLTIMKRYDCCFDFDYLTDDEYLENANELMEITSDIFDQVYEVIRMKTVIKIMFDRLWEKLTPQF